MTTPMASSPAGPQEASDPPHAHRKVQLKPRVTDEEQEKEAEAADSDPAPGEAEDSDPTPAEAEPEEQTSPAAAPTDSSDAEPAVVVIIVIIIVIIVILLIAIFFFIINIVIMDSIGVIIRSPCKDMISGALHSRCKCAIFLDSGHDDTLHQRSLDLWIVSKLDRRSDAVAVVVDTCCRKKISHRF